MKFSPVERVKLLEILPDHGSIFNLKILRKLREGLSFGEEELKMVIIRQEYHCPYRNELGQRCENSGYFPEALKCGMHNLLMEPTGLANFNFLPEFPDKEVFMGPEAISIIAETLKQFDAGGELTDQHISLYEKFFPLKETEVPKAIEKSME